MSSAGKGDDFRKVNKKIYDKNFEAIFGKSKTDIDRSNDICGGPNCCENRSFDPKEKDCQDCSKEASDSLQQSTDMQE